MAVILIVDDDPTLRAFAKELLRETDHAILEAEDGDAALRLLVHVSVDLVVLDMLMPNRDGLEVLMAIRARPDPVPVLAITSGGSLDAELLLRSARAFGADAVLRKPLRSAEFNPLVRDLLAGGLSDEPSRLEQV
jgi:CheY-like chemotaxis protein